MPTQKPRILVKPKKKTKSEQKKAKIMSEFLTWEYNNIMDSTLKTPFMRALNARWMSIQLFGYIDPVFVKEKEDQFLKEYKEYLDESQEEKK